MTNAIHQRRLRQAEREKLIQELWLDACKAKLPSHRFSIPAEPKRIRASPLRFIRELPIIAEAAVSARYGAKGILILKARLLRTDNKPRLHEISAQLGVTREAIRLMETRILGMFARIFFDRYY